MSRTMRCILVCPSLCSFIHLDSSVVVQHHQLTRVVLTFGIVQEELNATRTLPIEPTLVPWLNKKLAFYTIPGEFPLSRSHVFRQGRVYGMDISSGAAVAVLLSNEHDDMPAKTDSSTTSILQEEDNDATEKNSTDTTIPCTPTSDHTTQVLDLCCAPGLKLCMMADVLSSSSSSCPNSLVVGVDIDEKRLSVCRNIVTKYQLTPSSTVGDPTKSETRIQLHLGDGTTFGSRTSPSVLQFDSRVAREESVVTSTRKRRNKSARGRESKRLKQIQQEMWSTTTVVSSSSVTTNTSTPQQQQQYYFDYVLVDAECSTDGSLKHVALRPSKQQQQSSLTVTSGRVQNDQLTNAAQLQELVVLQRQLLQSGFRSLRPGGVLVYATCSLSVEQNEGVVEWFLQHYKEEADLVPVRFGHVSTPKRVREGVLAGTVRFVPTVPGTAQEQDCFAGGGFFLAKIVKKQKKKK